MLYYHLKIASDLFTGPGDPYAMILDYLNERVNVYQPKIVAT